MQTDARFIEDIKDSSKAGPDLGGEPDPLCFAATESTALAIQREITQPDLKQELQTRFNFTHHFRRDLLLLGRERDLGNKLRRRFNRQLGKLMDIERSLGPGLGSRLRRDRHRQNLRPETRAAANFAWLAGHEGTNSIAGEFAFGFLVEPLHLWDQTLKRP